jgi:hypothetical protein
MESDFVIDLKTAHALNLQIIPFSASPDDIIE